MRKIKVGIDASRIRSGGAIAHLTGILTEGNPQSFDIIEVHVWSYEKLLSTIPDQPWLVKHNPPVLERSIIHQIWWQRFTFPDEVRATGCNIVFNTDAGTVSSVRPSVTLSQDMLSYEPGVMELFGFGKSRLRLILLRYIQNWSLRNADGVIFLTRYSGHVIQKYCGQLKSVAYIPHGIDREFAETHYTRQWPQSGEDEIHCIYVSNASLYKYQWNVVRAIAGLRRRGYNLTLSLVGGGKGPAQQLLSETIEACDSEGLFIRQFPFIPHKDIPKLVASSDIFIFASGCENMPVTLLEGMAVGLPIACSNRGPMPEILADGGEYFDPEEEMSIASAVERIIADSDARETLAKRAKSLSSKYSWEKCADETWDFIVTTYGRTTR